MEKIIKEIIGKINHRILSNYRIEPQVAQSVLPKEFKPKLIHGFAIGGICQVSLSDMRPNGLPVIAGTKSHNAAHRIAVISPAGEGDYIPRRDTNSILNSISGGRIFPGIYMKSDFKVINEGDNYIVEIKDKYNKIIMYINCSISEELDQMSIFESVDEVSSFFKSGNIGWSPKKQNGEFDVIELKTVGWKMEPLKVNDHFSAYFNDETIFPKGSVTFDSAMIMRNLEHSWISREGLRYLSCCQ